MSSYLSFSFKDNEEFISTFDELPLWSAPFGLLLLKHIDYRPNLTILDIGSGAGFPLMEIASRFGNTCKCFGLDVWTNANNRARQKIAAYQLPNVEVIEGSADNIPFDDNSFDLIVSNLGINNFTNPATVFIECKRVLKPQGKLALTTNLNGHWQEFYKIFEDTLLQLGKLQLLPKLKEHQEHRGSIDSISAMFHQAGLLVRKTHEESFEMKFVDGSAFLNHHFVKLGWLSSWMELLEGEDLEGIFTLLEQSLNVYARKNGALTLTVPMAFLEGQKQ